MAFSRQTLWVGELPQSAVTMQQMRDSSKSLFQFIADAMGSTNAAFSGLAATPGTGLTIDIGAGALYQFNEIDPTTWSSLAADTSSWLLQGLSVAQVLSGFAAPATSGDSVNYLIEAQIAVTDSPAVNLPFTNGANPPATVQEAQSPSRVNVINFQVLAGTAAATGSQVTPTPTAGWVPLWQVTVDYGEVSLTTADIALAANAPQFSGFVHSNPNGETPVFLSSPTAQSGFIDVTGNITGGGIIAATSLFGGAAATTNFDGTWANGFAGDYLSLTAAGFTGSKQTTDSLDVAGSIGYTGTHAGTDADPYPVSELNVAMFGGKLPADYALASGSYVTLYAGAPTAGAGNAAITGYFEANVAPGTAPIQVVSTTVCPNLNASLLGGYAAGNSSQNIPVSNGTMNLNLNAQYLNGLASSAFQLAGNYAAMNVTNAGAFTASGLLESTGGTSGTQVSLGYVASNALGMNAGGALSIVQSTNAPLGIDASKVLTSGPLYVGGDNANQNVYAQDLIPNGLLRSGQLIYRVSYAANPQQSAYPYPGGPGVVDYGYEVSGAGSLALSFADSSSGQFSIGYRCLVTFAAPQTLTFNVLGDEGLHFAVDGLVVGAGKTFTYTFSAGQHTIDVIFTSVSMGLDFYLGSGGVQYPNGGVLKLFGWLPMPNGKLTSNITEIIPG